MKLFSFRVKKTWGGFDLNNPQGTNSLNRMKVFTIDLTLNLMLSLVVLTLVTTRSFEFTDSSILNLLHTNAAVCDFEIPLNVLDHQ